MGSVGSVLRDVGKGAMKVAKQTAAGAVAGASQTIGDKLRNWLSPGGGPSPSGRPPAPNYLPWILGGAAAVGLVVLARRRA